MSTKENIENARHVMGDAMVKGDLSSLDKYFATNYVAHVSGMPDFIGPEGFKQFAMMYRTAFSDLKLTMEDTIAEGDKVVNQWTFSGTHTGVLAGIAPTGKRITGSGITISHYKGGKQVEAWVCMDQLGMMQQMGVIPATGQSGG